MSLEQSEQKEPVVQKAQDEYVPVAVSCLPEGVSPASLNEQNRKYWANAGGEQTGGK